MNIKYNVKCFADQPIKELLNSIVTALESKLKKETRSEQVLSTEDLWNEMWKVARENDDFYEKLKSFYEFFEKTAFYPVKNPPEEVETIKKRTFISAILIATNRLKAPTIVKNEVEKIITEFDGTSASR